MLKKKKRYKRHGTPPRKYYPSNGHATNRYDLAYLRWRRTVLKRDGRCCQMPSCTMNNIHKLQVHHIRRWVDLPILRYDIDNGITLCYPCHKKITGCEDIWAPLFIQIVYSKKVINLAEKADAKRAKMDKRKEDQ